MRELCVTVFWTSWALRLTSLSPSFLLASRLGLLRPSPFGDYDNLCSLWFNVPKVSYPWRRPTITLVHPGAGVSSICHVARKVRLFPERRALRPKTNLGLGK